MRSATSPRRCAGAAPGLIEGIELTQRDCVNAFARHKIVKISPQPGERFDPKLHQAMFEAPVPGTKAGDIIQVMSEGFTIGDRLLRPAQVGVSSGGPAMPAGLSSGAGPRRRKWRMAQSHDQERHHRRAITALRWCQMKGTMSVEWPNL